MITRYTVTTENCFAPMVVKRTLFATPVASFLFGPRSTHICYTRRVIVIRRLLYHRGCNHRALYMSTIVTTRDYTSKCLNKLPWIKFKHHYFLQICIDHALSCMHFVCKKGPGCCTFSSSYHNYQGGTGNFIYKASILSGQQKTLYHQNYLPCRWLAIYFAQTTQLFIITLASYTAS